ncbi:4-(cytidine 5'-diphospho)-2-C-methyl-D-erythritol kinase [uncultured Mediterranea sp.]|uniref:4-(cytidine 5'-diphospho)-2-C-methyl-D-erythritol kinase n=1 Tax=uncultured Mediterranea sp. TaxID=1926662 RepID=UPI002805D678|nr:4-(cytidine 5'-diphospho)-2-C-methyl-D-erythritol kinase [uncultured Mediterranea sp.]
MITFPNAKINLGLNITEKRPDGYHNLETIFYPIPLEDALEACPRKEGPGCYSLSQSGLSIEGDAENNLVVKAYKLLDETYHLPPVDIYLHKHIPSGAGLGGGSADAAFMLKLLNRMYRLNLTDDQLEAYAARLGADCAFFVRNQPTYAEGIGNIFSPVELSLAGWQLLLVKPNIFVSTRDAFARIRPRHPERNLRNLINQPVESWKDSIINDFEESVFPQFPAIGDIKTELYHLGAVYASMSGSGSSVYGLFAPDAVLPDVDFGTDSQVFKLNLK